MIEISFEKENIEKTLVGKDDDMGGGFTPGFGAAAVVGGGWIGNRYCFKKKKELY